VKKKGYGGVPYSLWNPQNRGYRGYAYPTKPRPKIRGTGRSRTPQQTEKVWCTRPRTRGILQTRIAADCGWRAAASELPSAAECPTTMRFFPARIGTYSEGRVNGARQLRLVAPCCRAPQIE